MARAETEGKLPKRLKFMTKSTLVTNLCSEVTPRTVAHQVKVLAVSKIKTKRANQEAED